MSSESTNNLTPTISNAIREKSVDKISSISKSQKDNFINFLDQIKQKRISKKEIEIMEKHITEVTEAKAKGDAKGDIFLYNVKDKKRSIPLNKITSILQSKQPKTQSKSTTDENDTNKDSLLDKIHKYFKSKNKRYISKKNEENPSITQNDGVINDDVIKYSEIFKTVDTEKSYIKAKKEYETIQKVIDNPPSFKSGGDDFNSDKKSWEVAKKEYLETAEEKYYRTYHMKARGIKEHHESEYPYILALASIFYYSIWFLIFAYSALYATKHFNKKSKTAWSEWKIVELLVDPITFKNEDSFIFPDSIDENQNEPKKHTLHKLIYCLLRVLLFFFVISSFINTLQFGFSSILVWARTFPFMRKLQAVKIQDTSESAPIHFIQKLGFFPTLVEHYDILEGKDETSIPPNWDNVFKKLWDDYKKYFGIMCYLILIIVICMITIYATVSEPDDIKSETLFWVFLGFLAFEIAIMWLKTCTGILNIDVKKNIVPFVALMFLELMIILAFITLYIKCDESKLDDAEDSEKTRSGGLHPYLPLLLSSIVICSFITKINL